MVENPEGDVFADTSPDFVTIQQRSANDRLMSV
jgi:hypothetical protein